MVEIFRYTGSLSDFSLEDLIEFADAHFKELGFLKPQRKKLFPAIGSFNVKSSLSDQV